VKFQPIVLPTKNNNTEESSEWFPEIPAHFQLKVQFSDPSLNILIIKKL
jgi:hypothetical protein